MARLLTVWLSETEDYENFEEGVLDADSFSVVVQSTNEIAWLSSMDTLFVGTFGDEWQIMSNNFDTPLTPTNARPKQLSAYGSKDIQPIDVGEALLFVDSVGRKVREITSQEREGKSTSPDLTALSEHITQSGIVEIAMQYAPDQILWCVLDNGDAVIMVYEREQNCIGWAKVPIDGFVQSICMGGEGGEDEVYLDIFRTITGETLYWEDEVLTWEGEPVTLVQYNIYYEKMALRVFGTDIKDAYFVDCGITFESYIPTTTVTGLGHLVGETVAVLADGIVQTSKIVDANGEITLDAAASKVQVGLAFTPKLEPLKPVINTQMGTTAASIVSVPEMGISFLNTAGATYGTSLDNMFDINFEDERWVNLSEIDGLFTGTVTVSMAGGFSLEAPLIISSDSPLPLTVRALIPRMTQTGR